MAVWEPPEHFIGRRPETLRLLRFLDCHHLPQKLSCAWGPFWEVAVELIEQLRDGPELTVALRFLVQAKDCAVRQRIEDLEAMEAEVAQ